MKDRSPATIPLSRKLITTVVKTATYFTEEVSQTLKEEKITIQQFNVLRILRGRKGKPASLQDVTKDMLHANSNTTRVVDKLVAKGCAVRVQCPSDRRQIELTITQEGLDLLARLDDKVDHKEKELLGDISESDMHLLISSLELIKQ